MTQVIAFMTGLHSFCALAGLQSCCSGIHGKDDVTYDFAQMTRSYVKL